MKEKNVTTKSSRIEKEPNLQQIPRVRATLFISVTLVALTSIVLMLLFVLQYGMPNSANWTLFTSSVHAAFVTAAENIAEIYSTMPSGAEFVRVSGLYNPVEYVNSVLVPMLPMLPAFIIVFFNIVAYIILLLHEKFTNKTFRVEKQLTYKPIAVGIFFFTFFYNMLIGMTPNHPTARAASMICLTIILMYLPGFFLLGIKRLTAVNPLTGRRSTVILILFPFLAVIALLSGMWNIISIMIMMVAYMGAFGEIIRAMMKRGFKPPGI